MPAVPSPRFAFAILPVVLASAGCAAPAGRACTEIGCTSGYQIALAHPDAWPAGHYRFTLVVDERSVTCDVALPLPACGAGVSGHCEPAGLVRIGESGCALPAAQHGLTDIDFAGASPTQVRVTVARDGAVLVAQSFAPTYATSRPNGPGCEPVCRQARDTLAVP